MGPVLADLSDFPFDTLDGTVLLGVDEGQDAALVVRSGLPVRTFDALQDALGLTALALAEALAIPPRTLSRRRTSERFSSAESDRILRVARLTEMAAVALGDTSAAAEWMVSPHALFGESPLHHADTAPGAREVEDALYAIEFSSAA